MDIQPPNTTVERRGRGLPNSEILGPEALEFPPVLDDFGHDTPQGFRLKTLHEVMDNLINLIMPPAWTNGKFLSGLRWLGPLDARLPPPSPHDHSVYLITVPRGQWRYRFTHWSLYSQGYFYHLTVAGSDALHYMEAKSGKTSPSQLNRKIPVALKIQNVINPADADFILPTNKTQKTALQAYQVGYTRFTSEQIRRLATYIISELKSYNVFDDNCQLFALSLTRRTVMAQRNCSVFVGDMHQIAKWDSTRGFGSERLFSKSTGYVLADAKDKYTNPRTAIEMAKLILRCSGLSSKASDIAILYRDGEHAVGAYDPSGQREGIRYALYLFRRDLDTGRADENWEDFKQRRWRDAFFGRLDSRKSSYIRRVARVINGDRMAGLSLWFDRWSLRITQEERLMWEAEAAEVDSRPGEDAAADWLQWVQLTT